MSDHSHAPVEAEIAFVDAFGDWDVAAPGRRRGAGDAEIALCPSQRAAMVYVLRRGGARRASAAARRGGRATLEGVDLVAVARRRRRASIASRARRAALRPGGDAARPPRRRWTRRGDLEVLPRGRDGG